MKSVFLPLSGCNTHAQERKLKQLMRTIVSNIFLFVVIISVILSKEMSIKSISSHENFKLNDLLNRINNLTLISKVDLSDCKLESIPNELYKISNDITLLNFGNNNISTLESNISQFINLRILFFASNKFTTIPIHLSTLPSLFMLSFKSNCINSVPSNSLNSNLGWLILTDNEITELPSNFGIICPNMKKLMLAGNKLVNLPESLINCNNLELLRISANQINSIPYWIFSLPKLSWIALAGNPITINNNVNTNIRIISWKDITIKEILGEGASGIVYKAILHENDQDVDVAVKIYKGMATSDGLPEDEMKTAEIVGDHPNSIQVIGRLAEIPDNKQGLVLSLIPSTYITLGNPPSFDTVTRDVYNPNLRLSLEVVLEILLGVSSLSSHLHSKYISHGDLYAHNILVDISTGHTLLGDFGASTNYYHMITINNNHDIDIARGMQGIEVRAFGYLAEELISLLIEDANVTDRQIIINDLNALVEQCLCTNVFLRPLFSDINRKLSSLKDLFLSIEKR